MGGYEKIQDLFARPSVKFVITGARADSLEEARVVLQDPVTVQRKQFENTPPDMRPADPVNLKEKYQIDCFNTLQLCIVLCREKIVSKKLLDVLKATKRKFPRVDVFYITS